MLAVAHIVGAVIVLVAFGIGVLALAGWETERNRKAGLEEMSIALGIPVDRLDDPENATKLVQFLAERFSSERLQNRISDLCWWIVAAWTWLGNLIQGGILIGVIWYSFADGPSNAIYAWSAPAIALLFWVVGVAFAFVCKLFTGRFPGQARQGRKSLSEFVRQQQSVSTQSPSDI